MRQLHTRRFKHVAQLACPTLTVLPAAKGPDLLILGKDERVHRSTNNFLDAFVHESKNLLGLLAEGRASVATLPTIVLGRLAASPSVKAAC